LEQPFFVTATDADCGNDAFRCDSSGVSLFEQ
jgi:hypothetical protein